MKYTKEDLLEMLVLDVLDKSFNEETSSEVNKLDNLSFVVKKDFDFISVHDSEFVRSRNVYTKLYNELTKSEFDDLINEIKIGRKAKKRLATVTDEKERKYLERKVQAYRDAKNTLITFKFKLVYDVVRDYFVRNSHCYSSKDILDFVIDASVGLDYACETYDPALSSFEHYAKEMITYRLYGSLASFNSEYGKTGMKNHSKIINTYIKYKKDYFVYPDSETLFEILKNQGAKVTLEEVKESIELHNNPYLLSSDIVTTNDEGDEITLNDMAIDESSDVERKYISEVVSNAIFTKLREIVDETSLKVLRYRIIKGYTFPLIGEELKLSEDDARQKYNRAILKIRSSKAAQSLLDYIA